MQCTGSFGERRTGGQDVVDDDAPAAGHAVELPPRNPHRPPDPAGAGTASEALLTAGEAARSCPPMRLPQHIQHRRARRQAPRGGSAEQEVHRAEAPPHECTGAAGDGYQADAGVVGHRSVDRTGQCPGQDPPQLVLAVALERKDSLCKLVPVDPCRDNGKYHAATDIHECRRLRFSPERMLCQVPDPPFAGYAEGQVLHAAADAVNGNRQRQQLSGGTCHPVGCTQEPPVMHSPVLCGPQRRRPEVRVASQGVSGAAVVLGRCWSSHPFILPPRALPAKAQGRLCGKVRYQG